MAHDALSAHYVLDEPRRRAEKQRSVNSPTSKMRSVRWWQSAHLKKSMPATTQRDWFPGCQSSG